ncbi:MAG: hypothetical protein IKA46_01065 [Clostridia bacterium]|nr:hypothetical protein [Clostridia bacterium]MBR3862583.1 hypothetical protein [Clostridia bacterium]
MNRYIIRNNVPVSPPASGVTAKGKVISNFANRIKNDAIFAAANGYYPLAEVTPLEEKLEAAPWGEGRYALIDGKWVFEHE